jgi:hypothetical protein
MTKIPAFPSEIVYSKITFEKTTKKDGPKTYKTKYDGHAFDVVVGNIDVPFGVSNNSKFNKDNKADYIVKYQIDLSLDTSNDKIKQFKNFLEKVDEVNYKFISENSIEMFGKSFTIDEVKKFKDCSLITVTKDKETGQKSVKYSDRFRVKLPFFNGEPKFQVFDKKGNEIVIYNKETGEVDWSWAQNKMKINPIIQSDGILVLPTGAVYCKWRIIALRIVEYVSTAITNDAFRDNVEQDHVDDMVVEEDVEEEE